MAVSEADEFKRFCKTILISYVTKEAENHARRLKKELQSLGFDIFLDVDEIEGGDDWVDALNHAVLNCKIFIPLITPRYGFTRWTNREIKLADIKNKVIIPINFLDYWPPECLAIQMASTHYIPWKKTSLTEVDGKQRERDIDFRFWADHSIRVVANEIADYLRRKKLLDAKSDRPKLDGFPFISKAALGGGKIKPLIVISVHSAQKAFADQISQQLSKSSFKVWSTADLTIDRFYSGSNNPMTPTVEGQTCSLSPEDFDRARYFKGQVDASSLVIIILSDDYCNSIVCRQQAFYCETRKKIIALKYNEFENTEWLTELFDSDQILEYDDQDSHTFLDQLTERVSKRVKSKKAFPGLPSKEETKPEEEA